MLLTLIPLPPPPRRAAWITLLLGPQAGNLTDRISLVQAVRCRAGSVASGWVLQACFLKLQRLHSDASTLQRSFGPCSLSTTGGRELVFSYFPHPIVVSSISLSLSFPSLFALLCPASFFSFWAVEWISQQWCVSHSFSGIFRGDEK